MSSPFAALPGSRDCQYWRRGALVTMAGGLVGALVGGVTALVSGDAASSSAAVAAVWGVEIAATSAFVYMMLPESRHRALDTKKRMSPLAALAIL